MATIHEKESPTGKKANQALSKKYGLMKRFFDFLGFIQRNQMLFIEITPQ